MYVFTSDGLMKADAEKALTTISKGMDGRANRIVMASDREFVLTSWGGVVYYVYGDGSNQVLLDTRESRIAAGINLTIRSKRSCE